MEKCFVLGNLKSGGKRRIQEEMWGPTRRSGSFGGRPPLSPGQWHQTVPQWEKKFCTSVCSIPWKKLCETRKLMYMYPTIVEWDDSEGEEAFRNAKARYWAKINHLPCPIPLPNPDLYIDIVDYNAVIDPELVEDLYKQPPPYQDDEGDEGIVWDSFQFTTDTVPVTGWGDEDDDPTIYATDKSIQIQPTGWGDNEEVPTTYSIGQSIEIQPTGWGDEGDQLAVICTGDQSIQIQPTGWVATENPTNEIIHEEIVHGNNFETVNCGTYQYNWDCSWQHRGCRNNGHSKKGNGGSRATGRYRGRKKINCAKEQPSCGSKGHGESDRSHGTWQWQKSVS